MKKSSKSLCCCIAAAFLLSVATTTPAQVLAPMQDVPQKQRQFALLFGPAAFVPGEESFGGGLFGFEYRPSPKNLFSAEIGFGIGPSDKIGEYSYEISQNGSVIKTLTDGKATYDYSFMQVLFSWNRIFNPSGKWQFRVGPSLGLMNISGRDEYSPTTYEGTAIEGLPKGESTTKTAFTGGGVAGVRWNVSQSIFLDLNYMLSAHTPVRFEQRTVDVLGQNVNLAAKNLGYIGHRVNLTLGWNLKTRKK